MTAHIDDLIRKTDSALGPGSPEARKIQATFFKSAPGEQVVFRGTRAPQLKEIAGGLYAEVKNWPVNDRDHLCENLWQWRDYEGGAIAIYLYRRFAKQCGAREFVLFTSWLD